MSNDNQMNAKLMEERLTARMNGIRHKIAVMSNKGGVGKSTVAVNLAVSLRKQGFSVGILDADLHGPSVMKMVGLEGEKLFHIEGQIFPLTDRHGLSVVSMAGMIESPDTPLIWRGPMKIGVIRQLLADVEWDSLDYLIIDLPPGTGDEPLTVAQMIPGITGAIVVTTPQDVATLDVRKAISFARQVNLPVIGIVENMSSMICPHCHESFSPFKRGGGKSIALDMNVAYLGDMALDPSVVELADSGKTVADSEADLSVKTQLDVIVDNILSYIESLQKTQMPQHTTEKGAHTMKIALPVHNGSLCSHFGHCERFMVFTIEDNKIISTHDLTPPPHEPGVLPAFLAEQGINTILAGGMGQRARSLFQEKGIEVVCGVVANEPEKVVLDYLAGTLETGVNHCDH